MPERPPAEIDVQESPETPSQKISRATVFFLRQQPLLRQSPLIANWTQEERGLIHSALTSLRVGAIKLDDATNTWCMPMMQNIPAKTTQAVCARGYMTMKPSKLVILEPQFEQVETETEKTKTWWGRWRERRIEHKRVVTVPRAIWRVRGMFVGANAQLPAEKDIAGDLFGPEGTLVLPDAVIPGLDVTVCVENTTSQAMPFYAVVLGTAVVERKLRESMQSADATS